MNEQLNGCVIALLVANGVHVDRVWRLRNALHARGARLHFIALHELPVKADDGTELAVDAPVGGISPRYYDGLVIPECRSVAEVLDVDDEAVALLQVFEDEQRPIAAIGNGVALLADASILSGRRITCEGDVLGHVREAGGVPGDEWIASDRLITTGRSGCDIDELVQLFADDVRAVRTRDYVDEISNESFPASDAHSGSTAIR